MTIGSANNIIIDGNICYADDVSGGTCTATPAAPSTDVLGLVADNYVEINHPVDNQGNNESNCSSTLGAGAVTCDLNSPYVDAVILALNHSFLVNNYTSGTSLGTLNMYGTIDQDWRGPVGTFSGSSVSSGYAKNYVYDPRLVFLSPPYYLNPGTSQWGFAAFTVEAGSCAARDGVAQQLGLHRLPVSRLLPRRRPGAGNLGARAAPRATRGRPAAPATVLVRGRGHRARPGTTRPGPLAPAWRRSLLRRALPGPPHPSGGVDGRVPRPAGGNRRPLRRTVRGTSFPCSAASTKLGSAARWSLARCSTWR